MASHLTVYGKYENLQAVGLEVWVWLDKDHLLCMFLAIIFTLSEVLDSYSS